MKRRRDKGGTIKLTSWEGKKDGEGGAINPLSVGWPPEHLARK